MKYEALDRFLYSDLERIISSGNMEQIKLLPLSVGEYNDDFEFSLSFCLKLLDASYDEEIRANAVLGLSYLVRRFRCLDINIMNQIKKELERNNAFKERVADSIEDINIFMGWIH
jgi:hypothetical protein